MASDDCRAENSEFIKGVEVKFPYKPYPLQKAYMNQVLTCVTDSKNGLLESPTGTGKTLSLLCSSLAWLKTKRETEKRDNKLKESKTEMFLDQESKNQQNTTSPNSFFEEFEKKDIETGKSNTEIDLKEEFAKNPNLLLKRKDKFMPSDCKQNGTRIVYSSRTHVQLSQAIGEMKKTNYSSMNAVVLGSRDHYCLNPEVTQLDNISTKNRSCLVKTKYNQCPYYSSFDAKIFTTPDYTDTPIHDIEDLVTLGKKHTLCPYYASKTLAQRADVVFVPYNYLIEKQARKSQKLGLKDAVVIIDEGHNIERSLEEAASTELSSQSLAICIKYLDVLIMELSEKEQETKPPVDEKQMDTSRQLELRKDTNINNRNLKVILCNMEQALDKVIMSVKDEKVFLRDNELYQILAKSNFDWSFLNVIDNLITYSVKRLDETPSLSIAINALHKLDHFLKTVYPDDVQKSDIQKSDWMLEIQKSDYLKNFKVFTVKDENTKSMDTKYREEWTKPDIGKSWTLNVFCLTPKVAMQSLMNCGVRSCIITSGTLSPLNSFEAELGVPFNITLQTSHIVGSKNLKVFTIGQGEDNEQLNSSYNNRDNPKYYHSLGVTVSEFIKYIPGGVFLFFSSYTVMNFSIRYWKKSAGGSIWRSISSSKQVFLETKNKASFDKNFKKYKQKVDEERSNGAVFFGVCRGKLAEGLDANDQYCRGVFIVGLPYPSLYELRVVFKKQYLDENKEAKMSSSEWYQLQMTRAVNQAVGRIIRHKDDYGVVLLLDNRFAHRKDDFSKWVKPLIYTQTFAESVKTVKDFFVERLKMMPKMEPEPERIEMQSFLHRPFENDKPSTSTLVNQCTKRSPVKMFNFEPPQSIFDAFYSSNTLDVEIRPACDLNRTDGLPDFKKRRLNVPLISLQPGIKGGVEQAAIENESTNWEKWFSTLTELKTLFTGTENFNRMCDAGLNYENNGSLKCFVEAIKSIFQDIQDIHVEKRNQYLVYISELIKDESDRQHFLNELGISIH